MKLLGLGDHVIDRYENLGLMYPGGNAVNVAIHAALLGTQSAYLGNLGDDAMSFVIRDALTSHHVDISACITIKGGTTKCCTYKVHDGERRFLNVDLGSHWSGPMILTARELSYLSAFDLIHCCCNAKMDTEIGKLMDCPAIITYDFGEKEKYRTDEYYDLTCPGLDLALFSCPAMSEEDIRCFCNPLHRRGVKHVLITMGCHGQCLSDGDRLIHGDAHFISPVDTMGAGDSFLAAFAVSLYQKGWKKGTVMDSSSLAAALKDGAEYSTENCLREGGFGAPAMKA